MRNLSLIGTQQSEDIQFVLEPLYSMQASLCLINDEAVGLHPWVEKMRRQLTEEELRDNRKFCRTAVFLDDKIWDSPDQWLEYVASLDDDYMIDSVLEHLRIKARRLPGFTRKPPEKEEVLNSREAFIEYMEVFLQAEDLPVEPGALEDEHYLLTHPAEKREFIIRHFRHMYDNYLQEEWQEHLQDLQDSIQAFRSVDYQSMDRIEAILEITQRQKFTPGITNMLLKAGQIRFIPSAHIGPYIMILGSSDSVLRIVHGARIPRGAALKSPSLVRAELLMKLEALADEHRLSLLHFISGRGEISSQEAIDYMEMSQSSVSRHLKQLTANGFLNMRYQDRMKFFSLNISKFEGMHQSLKHYIGG